MTKLNVQWNKEKYEVDYDAANGFEGFQALLFSLTNVPLDRQKLMVKGKMAKDAAALSGLKEGEKLVMMGAADALPAAPTKRIIFEEDLSEADKMVVKQLPSAGLRNLGNTCYMASTLQCLRAVPELKTALINKANGVQPQQHDPNHAVVRELGRLYSQMDKTTSPVVPMMFTQTFRSVFPQFDQTDNEGHHMQQDAEEAMIQLLNSMSITLKNTSVGSAASSADNNSIDEFFGFRTESRTVPIGTSALDSSAKVSTETQRRLRCFIDDKTNFLFQGIKAGLTEELELRGQVLERSSSLISLPKYLIIQMMRFGWRRDSKLKSKILRKVDYPIKFDVADFCHPALKHQLTCARNLLKDEQDEKLGLTSLTRKPKTADGQTAGTTAAAAAASGTDAAAAAAANPWAATSGAAAMEVDSGAGSSSSSSSGLTLTTGTSGQYELIGVVTHKGRSADGGHYIAWRKQEEKWLKFDDDVVTEVTEDEVKALSGGGDWHCAYLLFYRRLDDVARFVGKPIPEPTPAKTEPTTKKAEQKDSSSSAPPAAAAAK